MPGRHRKPTATGLRLARAGVLTLMATAPLAVTGSAMASPSHSDDGGSARDRHPYDDDYVSWADRDRDAEDSDSKDSDSRDSDSKDSGSKDDDSSSDAKDDGHHHFSDADYRLDHSDKGSKSRKSSSRDAEDQDLDDDEDEDGLRSVLDRGRATSHSTQRRQAVSGHSPKASEAKWDRLAQCESTQNWDANTGNGYRGGLQFTDSTWRAYGGKKYAPSADQANRSEQIAVAKKVQSSQGWNAWPSCSRQLGYA